MTAALLDLPFACRSGSNGEVDVYLEILAAHDYSMLWTLNEEMVSTKAVVLMTELGAGSLVLLNSIRGTIPSLFKMYVTTPDVFKIIAS
jgi:hypothetical protein